MEVKDGVTVSLWILVKPGEDGSFQGFYSSKGGEVVWTSYESGHSLPRFFLDRQEAVEIQESCRIRDNYGWVPLEVKLTIPGIGSSLLAWE
jgi:hypothetical protein